MYAKIINLRYNSKIKSKYLKYFNSFISYLNIYGFPKKYKIYWAFQNNIKNMNTFYVRFVIYR